MSTRFAALVVVLSLADAREGHHDIHGGGVTSAVGNTCRDLKAAYQDSSCCGSTLGQTTSYHVASTAYQKPSIYTSGPNPCENKKPVDASPGDGYFKNEDCMKDGVLKVLEQAGANVTVGYKGQIDASSREPILKQYWEEGLCPVNVHWHLGTEHLSVGEYDEKGTGPSNRRAGTVRRGFRCNKYDAADVKFTKPYKWKHCKNMVVGETYEVHWPHSAAGACATINQYQHPFYDGVFCRDGIVTLDPLNTYQKIGVQGQVFTIVNDEAYYYPDLMRGAIVEGEMWKHVTKYTGSTTGTTRNNEVCSKYTPITWQVDRKCHLISASSFDKMCADMMVQRDDMTDDVEAHGARELVADNLAANNQHNRRRGMYGEDIEYSAFDYFGA